MAAEKAPVGIVGGGNVGVGFIKQLGREEDVRVVGIVTRSESRQAELGRDYGVAAYGTVEAMMASEEAPEIVCVVSANESHGPDAIAALEAGAHVYLEKPMAPTLEECVAIVEAEKRSGCHLQVGFEYMHGTMTRRLKTLVDEGYFGDLTWASVLDSRGHWWSTRASADLSEIWKLDRSRGGGIIFHCGIHQLDMIRSYLGPIDEVTAYRGPKNALAFYPPDVPDNVTLMLKARSGAGVNFQVFHNRAPCYYRTVPPFHPDWRTVPGHEFTVSLVGTAGSCHMQIYKEKLHLFRFDLAQRDTRFDRTESFGPNPPSKSHHDMHGLLMRFIRSVASGGGAVDPSEEALETMRLAFAAEDAIARGTSVRIDDYR